MRSRSVDVNGGRHHLTAERFDMADRAQADAHRIAGGVI